MMCTTFVSADDRQLALATDEARNRMILDDVIRAAEEGRYLSIEECARLEELKKKAKREAKRQRRDGVNEPKRVSAASWDLWARSGVLELREPPVALAFE